LKRYNSFEQQQKYLDQMLGESEKAAELVDQLLLSVRLRKQSVQTQLQIISPRFRISDVLKRLKPRTQNWEIVEEYQTNAEIKADCDMFDRVLINLIENALKHAQEIPRLLIRVSLSDNLVEVEVIDCGPGIKDFFNENTTVDLLKHSLPYNPNRGGSGIGLFLVRQIIQLHEGEFLVKKNEGPGVAMITRWRAAENG
jgi:K+-sensing histidine kinase KdpD